jgi:hypothetical protein
MQIICPECGATIEIAVTNLHPLRWGTNDFPAIESICHEWRDPAKAEAKASYTCTALDGAVINAIVPDSRGDDT